MASSSSTFSSLLGAPTTLLSDNRSPPSCCSVRCSISSSPIGTPRSSRLDYFTAPKRRNLVVNSTVSFRDPTTCGSKENEGIESLKLRVLSVVWGLNKGLVATVDDLQRAETAAKELEADGGFNR